MINAVEDPINSAGDAIASDLTRATAIGRGGEGGAGEGGAVIRRSAVLP
ncbi:MAG: hypothetical protein U5N53_16570 [Mycobacterium sp.]|nr:hypothetical protein [Mycobacterium sp.]